MKKQLSVMVLALLLPAMNFASSGSGKSGSSGQEYVSNQVNVLLAPGSSIDEVASRYGAVVLEGMPNSDCFRLALQSGSVEDALKRMAPDLEIASAYPNFLLEPAEVRQASQAFLDPSSSPFVDGVSPTNFYSQPFLSQLHLTEALEKTTGSGVTVAV